MKKILPLVIALLSLETLHGQILNFEKIRSTIDTTKDWRLSLDARFDLRRKIATSSVFHTGINNYYLSKLHGYYLVGDINFTRIDGESIFNQGFAHARTVLNRTGKVSYETFAQLQYDLGKGLKRRYLGGANVRANLLSDSLKILTIGTGLFYEDEAWLNEENTQLLNRNLKSNNYVSSMWQVSDWSRLVFTGYYQATFDDFLNGRLILDSNLILNFTDRFKYTVTFTLSADKRPVVETGRLVYHLSTGFRYTFN